MGNPGFESWKENKFFLIHVSGVKLQGCQGDHMHPIPKLNNGGATLNSPYMPSWHGQVQIYFRLLSNFRRPVESVFVICRSPVWTVIAYAEAQYRLSLPFAEA
jgi:hypothetical protein